MASSDSFDRENNRHANERSRQDTRDEVSGRRPSVEATAADLAAYQRRTELASESHVASTARRAAEARLERLDFTNDRALMADVGFHRALTRVYREPESAREAFLSVSAERGPAEAIRRMREEPERYGALSSTRRSVAFGLIQREDKEPARAAALEAAALGKESLTAHQSLADVAKAVRASRIEDDRATDLRIVQQFSRELGTLYRDPTRAHTEFDQVARQHGVERAADSLREHPWLYGQLKDDAQLDPYARRVLARVTDLAPEAARAARALPGAEARLAREAGAFARAPDLAAERQLGVAAIDRAFRRESVLSAQMASMPKIEVLERRISESMRRLAPDDIRRLERVATPSQMILANKLREMGRQLVLGQDQGRGD